MEKKKQFLKIFITCIFSLLIIFYIIGINLMKKYLQELPPLQVLERYQPNLTTKIYDIEGRLISELFTERRTAVSLSEIPVDLQNAVIAFSSNFIFITPFGFVLPASSHLPWSG